LTLRGGKEKKKRGDDLFTACDKVKGGLIEKRPVKQTGGEAEPKEGLLGRGGGQARCS